jgi:hypothetical protein
LKNILTGAGNTVEYVGTVATGNMPNPNTQGYEESTIAEIAKFTGAYSTRLNVVLLHAGTYDLNLWVPSQFATAPQRLDSLVGQLLAACPDYTIIVARIIPYASSHLGFAELVRVFNNAVTSLMATRVQAGQRVMIVDMPSAITPADLADGLNPNDQGYNKMALKWAIALTAVNSLGWIKAPV